MSKKEKVYMNFYCHHTKVFNGGINVRIRKAFVSGDRLPSFHHRFRCYDDSSEPRRMAVARDCPVFTIPLNYILVREPEGNVLIFMTGQDHIEKLVSRLEDKVRALEEGSCMDAIILPLHVPEILTSSLAGSINWTFQILTSSNLIFLILLHSFH
ncbi:hypothetical protein PIB30_046665 [Stylosanthes scabra]|uniref:Uncharacterized protein n=1 Tax=Stylosanthes scabra TaxID=79078 RepID=A0ABU6RGJ9_9FABA|nr:hypothetical protein [Stylosanthes scabra]